MMRASFLLLSGVSGDVGLMLAFGPGVTCEMALLRSRGWPSGS